MATPRQAQRTRNWTSPNFVRMITSHNETYVSEMSKYAETKEKICVLLWESNLISRIKCENFTRATIKKTKSEVWENCEAHCASCISYQCIGQNKHPTWLPFHSADLNSMLNLLVWTLTFHRERYINYQQSANLKICTITRKISRRLNLTTEDGYDQNRWISCTYSWPHQYDSSVVWVQNTIRQ